MTTEELLVAWASLTGRPPNQAQRRVMEHGDGPLWIIAGPGTGKSYALVLRCLYLLCVCKISPEAIVLTTFTKKTAAELEQRLLEALLQLSTLYPDLKTIDLSLMRMGTMHSLCFRFLTETPNSPFRHLKTLNALDEAFFVYTKSRFCQNKHDPQTEKVLLDLISWARNETCHKLPPRWERAKLFVTMYERILHDHIDRQRFAASKPIFSLLIQLIEEYEQVLTEHSFTNHALMVQQALDLLQTSEGRFVVEEVQAVIIDEYQDTNPLQASFYRTLAGRPPHNLCVVGDDDQAMYRFRGGTVGCMVRFPEECKQAWPDCTVSRIALIETYRSHPAIVNWVNTYITLHPVMEQPNARVREKGQLLARSTADPNDPVVWVIRGKKLSEAAQHFVAALKELKAQGILESYDQCALLARSMKPSNRNAAYPYIQALQSEGISLSMYGLPKDQAVYKQVLGTILIALDRAGTLMPANFAAFNAPLAQYVDECRELVSTDPILAPMARRINAWLLTKEVAGHISLTQLAQLILNAPPCIGAIQQDLQAEKVIFSLLQTLDSYDRIVNQGHHYIPLEEVLGKLRPKKGWIEHLYYVLLEGVQRAQFERDDQPGAATTSEALQVMTIHASKGLEFPIVAVVVEKYDQGVPDESHRMEQDVLPFRRDLATATEISPALLLGGTNEERAIQDIIRRHYVAYSRAQSVLFLLICDDHLQPPALGLGLNEEGISTLMSIWPQRTRKNRKTKSNGAEDKEGVQQYGLWG